METKPPLVLVGLLEGTEKLFQTHSSESDLCRLQTFFYKNGSSLTTGTVHTVQS